MNLVVDDAVEVKLKTKDTEEKRRELGTTPCARPRLRGGWEDGSEERLSV